MTTTILDYSQTIPRITIPAVPTHRLRTWIGVSALALATFAFGFGIGAIFIGAVFA